MKFSKKQIDRYSRQIILKKIGIAGQKKLLKSSVLIVGAGGLGSPIAIYLAALGIGKIGIIDKDSVEISNLTRQIIFSTSDLNNNLETKLFAEVGTYQTKTGMDIGIMIGSLDPFHFFDNIINTNENKLSFYLGTRQEYYFHDYNIEGSLFNDDAELVLESKKYRNKSCRVRKNKRSCLGNLQ